MSCSQKFQLRNCIFLLCHPTSDLCPAFEMWEKYIRNQDVNLRFQQQVWADYNVAKLIFKQKCKMTVLVDYISDADAN